MEAVDQEESKEAVANAVTTLSKCFHAQACPEGAWQVAAASVSKILQGQAMCQEINSDAEEWEDEEEDDKEVG